MKLLLVAPPSMTTVVSAMARRSRASASSRVAAVGDDLGDHRVEVGRDRVALPDTGVDPDAGTRGQVEQGDPAGRRREVAVGVLGIEPGLDRVAGLGRALTLEAATGGDVDLGLDQVDVGRDLGDGVLDLQPGVDLEEGEELLARVVEELDGAGAGVPHGDGEPLGRRLELVDLLGRSSTGEADSSITFWLRRWTEQSRTPIAQAVPWPSAMTCTSTCRAPVTSRSRKTTPLPNARCCLVAGALVGVRQVGVGGHHPDAATAAARGRLEHQRVADVAAAAVAPRGCRPGPGSTARPGRRPPRR